MREVVRIYGNIINTWSTDMGFRHPVTTQLELAYKDYDANTGDLIQEGSEDFSRDRYLNTIVKKLVWVWTGKLNKGGKRAFDYKGGIAYSKGQSKEVYKWLRAVASPEVRDISLR